MVESPEPAGEERRNSPCSRVSSWAIRSAVGCGTPRSVIPLKSVALDSICTIICSPVGAVCTASLQLRGLPSTCRANVPVSRPRRSFGSRPATVLIVASTESPICRSSGAASPHTSGLRRDPPDFSSRGAIHTPSTSCRTFTTVGVHSSIIVEARAMIAPCITFFVSSKPGVAVACSSRALLSSAVFPPRASRLTAGSTSPVSSEVSIVMPKRPRMPASTRRKWPNVSTFSVGVDLALCWAEYMNTGTSQARAIRNCPASTEGISQPSRAARANGTTASAAHMLGRRLSLVLSRVIQSLVHTHPKTPSHQQTSGRIDSPPPSPRCTHSGLGIGQTSSAPTAAAHTHHGSQRLTQGRSLFRKKPLRAIRSLR